jgi:hypothetical protein
MSAFMLNLKRQAAGPTSVSFMAGTSRGVFVTSKTAPIISGSMKDGREETGEGERNET